MEGREADDCDPCAAVARRLRPRAARRRGGGAARRRDHDRGRLLRRHRARRPAPPAHRRLDARASGLGHADPGDADPRGARTDAMPGPNRACYIGERLLAELEAAGPPDTLSDRVLATMRRVQWDVPAGFRDAGVFVSGRAGDGDRPERETRFAIWLPAENLILPRVDYVALRVTEGEIVMVPFAAVAELAGPHGTLLDECQLLVRASPPKTGARSSRALARSRSRRAGDLTSAAPRLHPAQPSPRLKAWDRCLRSGTRRARSTSSCISARRPGSPSRTYAVSGIAPQPAFRAAGARGKPSRRRHRLPLACRARGPSAAGGGRAASPWQVDGLRRLRRPHANPEFRAGFTRLLAAVAESPDRDHVRGGVPLPLPPPPDLRWAELHGIEVIHLLDESRHERHQVTPFARRPRRRRRLRSRPAARVAARVTAIGGRDARPVTARWCANGPSVCGAGDGAPLPLSAPEAGATCGAAAGALGATAPSAGAAAGDGTGSEGTTAACSSSALLSLAVRCRSSSFACIIATCIACTSARIRLTSRRNSCTSPPSPARAMPPGAPPTARPVAIMTAAGYRCSGSATSGGSPPLRL